MSFSTSPHIRIIALVGVAAVLGLMVLVIGLSRHSSQTSASTPVPVHRVRPRAKASPAPTRPAPVRPAQRPAAPKHRPNPFVRAALAQGWPRPVARLLGRNKVVVLELYSTDAPLDVQALHEAKAGAAQAGVVLLPVDVSRKKTDKVTRAVLRKVTVLSSPSTLVVRRPGTVFVKLDGFQDQASVAQAVANAAVPS
jgi:hypothetical protein